MKLRRWTVAVVSALACFLAGSAPEEKELPGTPPMEGLSFPGQPGPYTESERGNVERDAELELADMENRIRRLEVREEERPRKRLAERLLQDLEEKRNNVRRSLNDLENADAEHWIPFKERLDRAFVELRDSYGRAEDAFD